MSVLRSLPRHMRGLLVQAPVLWGLVLLMAVIIPLLTLRTDKPGEWFPFSHFPMYAGFEPRTYYVYVCDAGDQIVPISSTFGRSISDLKKTYDRKLDAIKHRAKGKKKIDLPPEIKAEAARETLLWLLTIVPEGKLPLVSAKKALRHEVDIAFTDGQITQADQLLGEVPTP
jgi:hypothetical protein